MKKPTMKLDEVIVLVIAFRRVILSDVCPWQTGLGSGSGAYAMKSCRAHSASLTEYGRGDDGVTSNTVAFQDAVNDLSKYADVGGFQLFALAGKWLTGSFNLTSHFTLYLDKDAVILASQDLNKWLVLKPLPSYSRGRYRSLIFCSNLTDVIVTGNTSNAKVFHYAVTHLPWFSYNGGGLLYVPARRWLTRNFNLTSHLTLYLVNDAVLLASQPLPSYGHGRESPGGRYASFTFGMNLTDVTLTGEGGMIDGQGEIWRRKFRGGKLKIMHSTSVQIWSLTLLNSPFWTLHPEYSRETFLSLCLGSKQ